MTSLSCARGSRAEQARGFGSARASSATLEELASVDVELVLIDAAGRPRRLPPEIAAILNSAR